MLIGQAVTQLTYSMQGPAFPGNPILYRDCLILYGMVFRW